MAGFLKNDCGTQCPLPAILLFGVAVLMLTKEKSFKIYSFDVQSWPEPPLTALFEGFIFYRHESNF